MDIRLLGIPLLKAQKVRTDDYRSLKIVLFGLFLLGIGAGNERGDHIHLNFGISKLELFVGLSLKKGWAR